jgi:hypothetical protein
VSKRALAVLVAIVTVGTVAVSAPAAGLVLQIRPKAISYGQEVVIRGTIPRARAGQQVSLFAHSCHFTGAARIRVLRTNKHGAFSFRISPALKTTYSVAWKKQKSHLVAVNVAPAVALQKQPGGYGVTVSAGGGSTFEGKQAALQRRVGKAWRTIGTTTLKLTSNPDALTSVSSGTVTAQVPRGTQLRALLPAAQAKPCYLGAASPVLKA